MTAAVIAFLAVGAGVAVGVGVVATPQATLTVSDAEANDSLGVSVAIDGDTLAAGANLRSSGQGVVYVFTRTGTSWTPQQTLAAADAENGDQFGWSVSLAGDTALAGARRKAFSRGAAYVFSRAGTTWTQQQKLSTDDAAAGDFFGYSVAMSGDTAVVGAPNKDATQGAVYVFRRTYETWTQQQKLVASDAADGAAFGNSVAMSGDTAVVGAFGTNAAYVFTRTGATWTEQQKLTAADAVVGDFFGDAVAVAGDTVLVGAFEQRLRHGAVYVFTRTGTTWTQQAKLVADDAAEGDQFGSSVSLAGDTAAVGALLAEGGRGATYVFTRTGTTWTQQARLGPDDSGEVDEFGDAVAVSGNTLAAGAPRTDGARGAAHVFVLSPVVDPPPPPAPAGYCLPTKVTAKVHAKHPATSTLAASGTLDTGSGAPDFAGAATFDVGGFHLDVPAFVAKGRTLTYAAGGVALTITPAKNGSSRATFSVKAVGDFAGKVDLDGPLTFRFANAAHDLGGTATLSAGVLRRRAVTTPNLSVLAASATIRGGGRDALNLTLEFATDGVVPAQAEDLTIGFGDAFTAPLADGWVRKRDTWVRTARAPGVTRAVVDYVKGTITIVGSRLDLGAFADGTNPVVVTITRGAETRSAAVRMVRAGTKLSY